MGTNSVLTPVTASIRFTDSRPLIWATARSICDSIDLDTPERTSTALTLAAWAAVAVGAVALGALLLVAGW